MAARMYFTFGGAPWPHCRYRDAPEADAPREKSWTGIEPHYDFLQRTQYLIEIYLVKVMRTIIVDCENVRTEVDFWSAYIRTVKPDGAQFFGRNLHAFEDAVLGGGPGWPGECHLHFVNTRPLDSIENGRFLEMLRGVVQRSAWIKICID